MRCLFPEQVMQIILSTTLQKMCQIHGSVLASVENQEEHNFIVALMRNTHSKCLDKLRVYI